jgi:hypothetical protein
MNKLEMIASLTGPERIGVFAFVIVGLIVVWYLGEHKK